ncbi:winged helix-turn-helix domain-containing protein [Sulfobacillus harzensis]|uniref:Winged helix-turn-helix transcriptional regulator n=1 Tax=Sulfobacillus harzensis TaxID=2729629 RepID=A0A7Y0Q582_9FIRM|nr:winged helix-turn-helix domain-containing protein [Sulfobacillus harzensis]NMP24811.1 winged helix-turn-helix transcriptional regulator [Sulfobacillus harzensis]
MVYQRKHRDGPIRFAPSDARPGVIITRPMTAEERARYWPETRKEHNVVDNPVEKTRENVGPLNPEPFTHLPGRHGSPDSAARTRDRVYALADEGLRASEIAKRLGIKSQTVSYHLGRRKAETPSQPEDPQTPDQGPSEAEDHSDSTSDRPKTDWIREFEAAQARQRWEEHRHRERMFELEEALLRKEQIIDQLRTLDAARAETIAAQWGHIASLETILQAYVRGNEVMGGLSNRLLEMALEPDNWPRLKAAIQLLLEAPAATRTESQP